MNDNVLMAYHIVPDKDDPKNVVLNTNKLYKWRITEKTTGKPAVGQVAIVKTRFAKRVPVVVFATKAVANDLSDLQPVIEFTGELPRTAAVTEAFEALL